MQHYTRGGNIMVSWEMLVDYFKKLPVSIIKCWGGEA